MSSLFPDHDTPSTGQSASAPLAERMRPRTFDEFVGQQELLAPGMPLREAIERDRLQSIVLWGPPGTGKTTLARIIADTTRARFVAFSAVLSGIKEIREVMADPPLQQGATGRVPPSRRSRRHRARRRDDRESIVRDQRGVAVALEGLRHARPDGR